MRVAEKDDSGFDVFAIPSASAKMGRRVFSGLKRKGMPHSLDDAASRVACILGVCF
jgi:hypothetical protein